MHTTTPRIIIKAVDPASRDQQLEQTCALLIREATSCGILVTRLEPTTFEVALSPDVAFGLTREVDLLWMRARPSVYTPSPIPIATEKS